MSKIDHEKRNRMDKVWRTGSSRVIGSSRPAKAKPKHTKKKMVAKFPGTCAVCRKSYFVGEDIWYDHTKQPGNKCAHWGCWKPR